MCFYCAYDSKCHLDLIMEFVRGLRSAQNCCSLVNKTQIHLISVEAPKCQEIWVYCCFQAVWGLLMPGISFSCSLHEKSITLEISGRCFSWLLWTKLPRNNSSGSLYYEIVTIIEKNLIALENWISFLQFSKQNKTKLSIEIP